MKRVLFLNENPLPSQFSQGTISGKELRLRSAIEEIDEVHVLARRGTSYVVKPGKANQTRTNLEKKIFVHYLPPWPYYFSSIGLFIWGWYWMWKLKPVVVEAESPLWSGPAVVILGKLFHVPSVVEIRASYIYLLKHRAKWIPEKIKIYLHDLIYWPVLKNADAVIANSKYYKKQVAKRRIKAVEINPGIQFPPKVNKSLEHKNTIGFIGRLVNEKGVDLLIQAFGLANKQLKNKWKLEIVGNGPEKNMLQNMTFHRGIAHLIEFYGVQDNYKSIARWSILINTTTVAAPLEMVNAEAAYLGVPVVCFGDKYLPETVVDGVTGYKVPTQDVLSLADAIVNLTSNPKLRNKFGENGRTFAMTNYSVEDQVHKLKKLYRKLKII